METLRIIDSEPEASLSPRVVWKYWKERVLPDPRTYYSLLEFIGVIVPILALQVWAEGYRKEYLPHSQQRMAEAIFILITVIPLHWYSNHRGATNILTRPRTHFIVLSLVAVTILICQLVPVSSYTCLSPGADDKSSCSEAGNAMSALLWMAIPTSLVAAFVIMEASRRPHPKVDPLLAELPEHPEDDPATVWSADNVADGIEDDGPETEGAVRLV
ncbi:hypothetical protein BDQ12DRAFT_686964 [Crucibulum laeve]|uniref:Uncharacterized protein n=1 Tax=Crucibulum laeve TaxID=68775 RepID=A0A5C3LTR4_9AGAR|nr:hypothetical protein BDQ12DRAFT_686964 [Crucibulum laeve]